MIQLTPTQKKVTKVVTISILSLIIFSIFIGCERIDAGHAGIKVKLAGSDKGVQDITEVTGWIFYNKLSYQIYEFPTFVQHKEYVDNESFIVNSKDGSEFHVSPIINYEVVPEKVSSVFRKYRRPLKEIESGFIKTAVYDAFRISANKYTADSLISNRESFERSVRKTLESQITAEGFRLQQLASNLIYPTTFKQAIDAKNAAVQRAFQIENEVKQQEAEARKSIVNTEAAAKIRIINANAYAEATLKEAKADAEAGRLRQSYINQTYINWMLAQSWDGKLPVYGQTPALFKDLGR